MQESSNFHVLTVGWSLDVIGRLADPIERATGFRFSHILDPSVDRKQLGSDARNGLHVIRKQVSEPMPDADPALLAGLEHPEVPTLHNAIMGDRLICTIPYDDALRYATYLVRRFLELFDAIRPSVIIGGFDGLHSAIG